MGGIGRVCLSARAVYGSAHQKEVFTMNLHSRQTSLSPDTCRRTFLKRFAGGATALSIFPTLGSAAVGDEFLRATKRMAVTGGVDESFWRLVKEQFTIKPKLIMLNAA